MKPISFLLFLTILSASLTALAQKPAGTKEKPGAVPATASPAPTPPSPVPAGPFPSAAGASDSGVVNYKYEVRGRRDPFRTLDVVNSIQATAAPIVRPPGLKGQLVSEIKPVGIVKSKDSIMAIAEGYRGRTFFIHPQDDLYDGKVLDIKNDSVIFSQTLTDSLGKKVMRQVVKKLHPTRGEGNNEK